MGLDFGDINGDGLFDIYVSNIADDFALHEGHFVFVSTGQTQEFEQGIAPYRQQSSALGLVRGGWGWDCRFADFDNDGRFVDINKSLGMAEPWNTRGLAIADVDGDGWQDFVAANQWEPSIFFHNQSRLKSGQNSFIALHLIMPPVKSELSNVRLHEGHPTKEILGRPAIGAIASISLPSGQKRVAFVDGGTGHSGKRSPTIHFGLGPQAPERIPVTLQWRDRSGRMQTETLDIPTAQWSTLELGKKG